MCHHSPRRISLAFRQHPLYSVGEPCICATALYEPCYSSLLSPTLLTSTFCFWLTFAYSQAEPPEPHHRLICNRHIYHICMSRSSAQPHGSIILENKLWNVVESETMEILSGDKVPLRDNKGATNGNCTLMYPPFLTSMLTSKGLCS